MRTLHEAITTANAPDHHKLSLLYYVLLDCDATTRQLQYSDAFEAKTFLPRKYQIYMKGLWHMDHLEFEVMSPHPCETIIYLLNLQTALQYLTYPSLIPTFPEEILEVLVHHAKLDDMTLPLAYYYTVQPALTSPIALENLFSAIARTSVTEAFYFSRGQADNSRRHMFQLLISAVLQDLASENVAERGVELVNLPLDREEEIWFRDYLTYGEGRNLRRASDTLMMRKIGAASFTEALSVQGISSKRIGGLSWGMMKDGIQDGLGSRHDAPAFDEL